MVTLNIVTKPAKAEVWIDSVMRGTTPFRIKIASSKEVAIRVSKSGFLSYKFNWKANANKTKRITLAPNIFR